MFFFQENGDLSNLSDEDKKLMDKISDEEFKNDFKRYCVFYRHWRKKVLPEEPIHPYEQFQRKFDEPEDIAIMNTGRSSAQLFVV